MQNEKTPSKIIKKALATATFGNAISKRQKPYKTHMEMEWNFEKIPESSSKTIVIRVLFGPESQVSILL